MGLRPRCSYTVIGPFKIKGKHVVKVICDLPDKHHGLHEDSAFGVVFDDEMHVGVK